MPDLGLLCLGVQEDKSLIKVIFLGTASSSLPNEQFWVSLVGHLAGSCPP